MAPALAHSWFSQVKPCPFSFNSVQDVITSHNRDYYSGSEHFAVQVSRSETTLLTALTSPHTQLAQSTRPGSWLASSTGCPAPRYLAPPALRPRPSLLPPPQTALPSALFFKVYLGCPGWPAGSLHTACSSPLQISVPKGLHRCSLPHLLAGSQHPHPHHPPSLRFVFYTFIHSPSVLDYKFGEDKDLCLFCPLLNLPARECLSLFGQQLFAE